MSDKEDETTDLKILLGMKQETFQNVMTDVHELYRQGRINFFLIGARGNVVTDEECAKLLAEKYKLPREELYDIEMAILACIHFVLYDEVESVAKSLSEKEAKSFNDKIGFIAQIMKKDDTIRKTFLLRNLSKMAFFRAIEWEAEMKVFSSPNQFLEKIPVLPVGRVRIHLYERRDYPPNTKTIEFEISLKDVENVIKYLEDLRKALKNLETVEIVPKKVK